MFVGPRSGSTPTSRGNCLAGELQGRKAALHIAPRGTDQSLVTSRYPGDIEAFRARTVEEIAECKHAEQSRSA